MSTRPSVVLLPGFQGSVDQPILVRLSTRLEGLGFDCVRRAPPRLRLTPALEAYGHWLDEQLAAISGPLLMVGRSFGARLAVRLASRRRLEALVLLGFPIRPPGKRRALDEEALSALTCPTWIAQGTRDALGPIRVLGEVASGNRHIEIFPVEGAGHSFGAQEPGVLDQAAAWCDSLSLRSGERAGVRGQTAHRILQGG